MNYLVRFYYGMSEYNFQILDSSADLSDEKFENKDVVVCEIEEFLKSNNLRVKDKIVHDVILFDTAGQILWSIEDLLEFYRKHDGTRP